MDRTTVTDAVRRWTMPVAVAAPLTAAVLHHDVGELAIGLSALSALACATATVVRHLLSEVLTHVRNVQQQRDQHQETMFREGNLHTEVMLVLDASTSEVDVVKAARAIRGTRTRRG